MKKDRSYENKVYYQRKKIKVDKLKRERLQIEVEKLKEVAREKVRLKVQSHRTQTRQKKSSKVKEANPKKEKSTKCN